MEEDCISSSARVMGSSGETASMSKGRPERRTSRKPLRDQEE
jgi:hypothetical protein